MRTSTAPRVSGEYAAHRLPLPVWAEWAGHCAIALARSGVARVHLIDFDVVTRSSLNRNPLLHPSMAGELKTDCLAGVLREHCPNTEILVSDVFISADSFKWSDPQGVSAVADAIDSLNPKTELLHTAWKRYCGVQQHGSRGEKGHNEGNDRRDREDLGMPLARMVRKYLRRRGITGGITCVWSTEKPMEPLPPDDEPRLERGRIRNTLPSLITLPGVFGYTMAQLILDHVSGKGLPPD